MGSRSRSRERRRSRDRRSRSRDRRSRSRERRRSRGRSPRRRRDPRDLSPRRSPRRDYNRGPPPRRQPRKAGCLQLLTLKISEKFNFLLWTPYNRNNLLDLQTEVCSSDRLTLQSLFKFWATIFRNTGTGLKFYEFSKTVKDSSNLSPKQSDRGFLMTLVTKKI